MDERSGLLAELAGWLAPGPKPGLQQPRMLVVGIPNRPLPELCRLVDAGLVAVPPAGGLESGSAAVDEQLEGDGDLLLLAVNGTDGLAATIAVAACVGAEPVRVVGFEGQLDDQEWVRRTVGVRDALRRLRGEADNPYRLLAVAGDPALSTAVGIVLQAAHREVPVVVDGASAVAAVLVAERLVPGVATWALIAGRPVGPAQRLAVAALPGALALDLDVPSGDGTAALLTVPMLRAAALLADPAVGQPS